MSKETRTYADRREVIIKSVNHRRKEIRLKAVKYAGGKCIRCDYNKYSEALEFHHRNPEQKLFGLGERGLTRSWEKVKNEIEKCDLLCANCHRELHAELDRKTNLTLS